MWVGGNSGESDKKIKAEVINGKFRPYVSRVLFSPLRSSMRHAQCPNSYFAAPNYLHSLAYSWKNGVEI